MLVALPGSGGRDIEEGVPEEDLARFVESLHVEHLGHLAHPIEHCALEGTPLLSGSTAE